MADLKISALTASTTPLAGTEVLPIVQSGTTKQVSVANLTAGRTVGTGALNTTGKITVNLDGATGLRLNNTTGGAGQGIEMLTAATKYSWLLGAQYNSNNGFEITPSTVVGGTSFTTPAFKVEDVGSNIFNAYIGTGNLVISTSGRGIDFSATPGTGTSELLADYEEGTWTPTLGGNATYSTQLARYVKVGKQVTVSFVLQVNAIGTGSTTTISGLPYAVGSANQYHNAGSLAYFDTLNVLVTSIVPRAVWTTSTIDFTVLTVAASASTTTAAIFKNGAYVIGNVTYLVD